jgi:hypothetical protein
MDCRVEPGNDGKRRGGSLSILYRFESANCQIAGIGDPHGLLIAGLYG